MFPLHFVGKGIRRRVLPTTKIPGNWQSFLCLDENKRELFGLLANEVTKEETEKLIISIIGSSVIMIRPFYNVSTLCPSNHKVADTCMLLHAANASQSGMAKVMIRTVETDVVVIALGMFSSLNLSELWISFGVGKNRFTPFLILLMLPNVMTCHTSMHLVDVTRFNFLQRKGRKAHGEPGKI